MNLFLFPESVNGSNGYSIAVNEDYKKLLPIRENGDVIIWYTNDKNLHNKNTSDFFIERPGLLCQKRFENLIKRKISTELSVHELRFLKGKIFDNIFCGDLLFYRAIREIYPEKKIQVRFHNCFSRIHDRQKLLKIHVGLKFNLVLDSAYRVEQEVFMDELVEKIFISEEDQAYYNLMTGFTDARVWNIPIDEEKMKKTRTNCNFSKRLVWVGGLEAHKEESMNWFIKSVYPSIKKEIPDVEFHMWGNRTLNFNDPDNRVYGHGFYKGNDIPFLGVGLYINPDIIGGGVKIKLKTYFEEGVTFISTPFGFEGYRKEMIDNKYCFVVEPSLWAKFIINLLKSNF